MYDYVIVGAGSAGCVLAARLTEDPATRVLLLEAGPPDTAGEIHIPAVQSLLFQSTYDWNYQTVPQERAAGRSVYWPRGRTLGGSSSINAMIYIRGSRYDYNSWRDEYGCEGWGYTDLLPYFLRAEGNSRGASAYHGASGPLSVTDPRHKSPLASAFVDAAGHAGLPANGDFNGARQDGVGFYQVTQQRGRRCSAADAYLHPAAGRPNLTIQTDALVTGIAVSGGHAVGVRYLLRGESQTAHAEGEIILAAGAIGSPQLLMLSGIGPADHLRSHGITVAADSPGVGGNLSDHPAVTAMWHTPKSRGLWEQAGRASLARWQLMHSGPMTTNIAESGGFSRSDAAIPAPDIQWQRCRPRTRTVASPIPRSARFRCSSPWWRCAAAAISGWPAPTRGTSRSSTRPTCPTGPTSSGWSPVFRWPGTSRHSGPCPRPASRSSRPAATCAATPRSGTSSGIT